ncbi:MAG: potassium channel protein [Candidatus Melainabacteria bacterium]|nr:MAG: potassium channel protein [Candidatus Melainabacteria bacterium]
MRDIGAVAVLVLIGTFGFMIIEHWRLLDALFMTVITLTTVGYGEVRPLSDSGKLFAMFVIFAGASTVVYVLGDMVELFVSFNFELRRMKDQIARLSGHYIVCGWGRTGQEVTEHFMVKKIPFVVVEADPVLARRARDAELLVIEGDATSDDVLLQAQIKKAAGVICGLPDDAANTFIVLSAKELNNEVTIVSRAANPGSESKLRRAGANMVISPYVIAGRRMATAVTHPLVTEFLDVVMHAPEYDLRIDQVNLSEASVLVGKTLKDANIKQQSGAMILAVNQSGKLITNPLPDQLFSSGDILIALGTEEELKKLAALAGIRRD